MKKIRVTAAVCAAVSLLTIAFLAWDTRRAFAPSKTILGVQIVIRAAAIVAALRGWIVAMVLLFAIAFVPIGYYFLGSPSYPAIAGLADLAYFAATLAAIVIAARARS